MNYMNWRKLYLCIWYIHNSIGTTKTTNHIPGYNGYLPKTDLNPNAVAHGAGELTRDTIIKQNIVENYSIKIPGYSGHAPMSVLNDRGILRPSCLTTAGEAFHWNNIVYISLAIQFNYDKYSFIFIFVCIIVKY